MWSTEAMLAFAVFVLLSNVYVVQYAESAVTYPGAVPTQPGTVPTQPGVTPGIPQNPAYGTPNQPGTQTGNLLEISTRIASLIGQLAQNVIHSKKSSLSTGLGLLSNMLTNSTQTGFGLKPDQTGALGSSPATTNPQTPTPTTPTFPQTYYPGQQAPTTFPGQQAPTTYPVQPAPTTFPVQPAPTTFPAQPAPAQPAPFVPGQMQPVAPPQQPGPIPPRP